MLVVVCHAAVGCLACTGCPWLPHEPLLFLLPIGFTPFLLFRGKALRKLFAPYHGNLAFKAINGLNPIDLHLVFRQDLVNLAATLNYITLFFLVHRLCPKGSFFCQNGYICVHEWVHFLSERIHGILRKHNIFLLLIFNLGFWFSKLLSFYFVFLPLP